MDGWQIILFYNNSMNFSFCHLRQSEFLLVEPVPLMGAADSLFLFQSGCIFLPQFGYCLFEAVAAPFPRGTCSGKG